MSKFDDAVTLYKQQNEELSLGISEDLLKAVAKGLGPAIYNPDSSKFSGTDKKEIETLKNNFLIKKLGLTDSPELDQGIAEILEKMGTGNKNKHRAVVYALLAMKFQKENIYM